MSDVRSINDFPPELLEKIFIAGLEYGGPRTRAPSSANLSHVCRRWRAIALACSRLWSTNLPCAGPDWTDLCLSRCSSALLDVNVVHDTATMNDVYYQTAIEHVLAHLDRVRSIRLHVKHHVGTGDLAAIFTEFFEAFHKYTAHCLSGLFIEIDHHYTHRPSLPRLSMNRGIASFFVSRAPMSNIRSVKFAGCKLTHCNGLPSGLVGQNVRDLMLYDSNLWADIDGAIACLQTTPMLEILHIQNHVYHFITASKLSHPPRCVRLPNIKEVLLRGSWQENIVLFESIAIPPHARLIIAANDELYTDFDPSDSDMVARTADAFRQHFSAALSQGAHYEELMISGRAEMLTLAVLPEFKIACSSAGPYHANDALPDFLELSIPWTAEAETRRRNALDVFGAFPIFTMAGTIHLDSYLWDHYPEIYTAYAHVRTVKIKYSVKWFIDGYSAKHAAIFPELERICFADVDFDEDDELLLRLVEHLLAVYLALKSVAFRGCRVGDAADWNMIRRRLGERDINLTYSE